MANVSMMAKNGSPEKQPIKGMIKSKSQGKLFVMKELVSGSPNKYQDEISESRVDVHNKPTNMGLI